MIIKQLLIEVVNDTLALANSLNKLALSISDEASTANPESNTSVNEVNITNTYQIEKTPTIEEVRAQMAERSRGGNKEGVKSILKKYGADKLTSLDPIHYAQVLDEVRELN
jgi:signal recognition particle subunit SEC65